MINSIISTGPDQYQTILEKYSLIVEKTNNQLNFWLNVSNHIVTILGIIVAAIAISVGFSIWKNSKEQKQQFKEFLNSQESLLKKKMNEFDESSKKTREKAEKELDNLISEQKEKLASSKEQDKKEIQKVIDDLRKEKAVIGVYTTNPLSYPMQNINCTGYSPISTVSGNKRL